MRSLLSAASLVAVLSAAAAAHAQTPYRNAPITLAPGALERLAPNLRCEVYLGIHIAFQNMGIVPIPAGTVAQWSLPNGASGYFQLPVTLNQTEAVLLEYALSSTVRSSACSVTL
jgi:hypothetical protein